MVNYNKTLNTNHNNLNITKIVINDVINIGIKINIYYLNMID